jgi:hypothetical protein
MMVSVVKLAVEGKEVSTFTPPTVRLVKLAVVGRAVKYPKPCTHVAAVTPPMVSVSVAIPPVTAKPPADIVIF